MIPVTRTFLPPQDEYQAILKKAWDKQWLTNRGGLVLELENKLTDYLGVDNVIAMTNGTLPLQIAIKAMGLTGEIITTPFSYVATTSSIAWEGCQPVFVDIHPDYLTIDETKIEEAITDKTSAIIATHVFGNPCHVLEIERIATKHNLKVIYDAAHCFGVNYMGKSIFSYGDVSTCSFHATKLFHTAEGGGVFCRDKELLKKLFFHHNFGHSGPDTFDSIGVNAKMSELQAAMGLAVLPFMEGIIKDRKEMVSIYKQNLNPERYKFVKIRVKTEWNASYFPVILKSEERLLRVVKKLNMQNIYPRRYFYPSLNNLPYVKNVTMRVGEDVSSRILCLPLFYGLKQEEQENIIQLLNSTI